MFDDIDKSSKSADLTDDLESPISEKTQPQHETNLLNAFLNNEDKAGQHTAGETVQPNNLDLYAALIPTLTLFQATPPGAGKERIDEQLLNKLSKQTPFNFALKATKSADDSCWEFPSISPPGLYGKSGKAYGNSKAAAPEEWRIIKACQPEKIPPQSRYPTLNDLQYLGSAMDRNGNFCTFLADDYYSLEDNSLRGRKIIYAYNDEGKGPSFKFQGLPADAETQGVGKNVHRIDITRDRDGESFTVNITSYPEERTHPTNGKVGWVPIRAKIVVSAADGSIMDQDNNGKKVKFTQTTYDDKLNPQKSEWRYNKNAWTAPYTNVWWRAPRQ